MKLVLIRICGMLKMDMASVADIGWCYISQDQRASTSMHMKISCVSMYSWGKAMDVSKDKYL